MPMSAYTNALLPMMSYPQPTLPAAIAGAFDTALALGLRLVGLAMQINPPPAAGFGGYAMPVVGTTIDAEEAKTRANADDIARDFLSRAKQCGIDAELRRVTCEALDGPGLAAATARLFDLAIIPVAPGSRVDRELAESVVFAAGRPCLLLPQHWASGSAPFDRPLIAWDAGRAAARALADALPLLQRAGEVFLIHVGPARSAAAQTLPDVERWLNDHGVRARVARIDGDGGVAAAAIAEHAREVGANLVVMGAFGHSRLRDFILGGVTQSFIAEPRIPVLFSH